MYVQGVPLIISLNKFRHFKQKIYYEKFEHFLKNNLFTTKPEKLLYGGIRVGSSL